MFDNSQISELPIIPPSPTAINEKGVLSWALNDPSQNVGSVNVTASVALTEVIHAAAYAGEIDYINSIALTEGRALLTRHDCVATDTNIGHFNVSNDNLFVHALLAHLQLSTQSRRAQTCVVHIGASL